MLACSAALFSVVRINTKHKIDINKETAMEKQNIYQFKVEDLSGNTFDFSTLREESNDRKYSFKMWIDTTDIWKRFTKNTKIKFRDHWISS
jgi:hypothetical protein